MKKITVILTFGLLVSACGNSNHPPLGGGVGLTLINFPETAKAGDCIGPYTLELQNDQGQAVEVGDDVVFVTTSDKLTHLTFFQDSSCSSVINDPTLYKTQSKFSFYLKDLVSETFSLKVSSGQLALSLITQVKANDTKTVTLSGPSAGVLGECIGPFHLETKDPFNNLSADVGLLSFTASPSANAISNKAFSDSSCSSEITKIQTASSGSVYFYIQSLATDTVIANVIFSTVIGGNVGSVPVNLSSI